MEEKNTVIAKGHAGSSRNGYTWCTHTPDSMHFLINRPKMQLWPKSMGIQALSTQRALLPPFKTALVRVLVPSYVMWLTQWPGSLSSSASWSVSGTLCWRSRTHRTVMRTGVGARGS